MFIVIPKLSQKLLRLLYCFMREQLCARPRPPSARSIGIVRLCSAYESFPPMGTHFKLRARHLGVRASLISADNKGKQRALPLAHNARVHAPSQQLPPRVEAFSLAGNAAIRRLWQPARRMRRPSTAQAERSRPSLRTRIRAARVCVRVCVGGKNIGKL